MRWFIATAVLSCPVLVAVGQASPRLNVVDGVVYVTGLGDQSQASNATQEFWKEMFSVYTDEAFMKGVLQSVAGKYLWNSEGFSFEPLYPFASGAIYHAVFSSAAFSNFINGQVAHQVEEELDFVFEIPREAVSTTTVQAVYPESEVLPENLLRMYVCFSAPMMPGEAYKHITLINEKGEPVEKPFLIVDQELWDASRTRFTILFDPGRIKRGLKSNLELGSPLKEGERYSLMIDSTWRDVHGNNLQRNLIKTFRVVAPERARLSDENLKVIAPAAGTCGPLVLCFDRPMDRVLLFKYVTIHDTLANTIRGQFELDNDRILRFTPDIPWQSGSYNVLLSPLLEDVAGNSLRNVFDLDLAQEKRQSFDEAVRLPVSIVHAAR